MHWYIYNDTVHLLNIAKTRIFYLVYNFKNFARNSLQFKGATTVCPLLYVTSGTFFLLSMLALYIFVINIYMIFLIFPHVSNCVCVVFSQVLMWLAMCVYVCCTCLGDLVCYKFFLSGPVCKPTML